MIDLSLHMKSVLESVPELLGVIMSLGGAQFDAFKQVNCISKITFKSDKSAIIITFHI